MPKCIIHVGMHKTGTTSIQTSLKDYADDNIYYARLGGRANHSRAIYHAFAEHPEKHKTKLSRTGDAAKMQRFASAMRAALETSIAEAGDRTLLISGEGIVNLEEADIEKFKAFLEERGCDVRVMAYVRSPSSHAESAFQHFLRNGKAKRLNMQRLFPKYAKRLGKFFTVMGADRLQLIKFDPDTFPDGDVVKDLCGRVGIPVEGMNIVRKNESLSLALSRLLFQYNRVREERDYPQVTMKTARALGMVLGDLDARKLRFGRDLMGPALREHARDVAWVEKHLGQPLAKAAPDDDDAIRGETDLLQPVEGAEEKLRTAIEITGARLANPGKADICDMIGAYIGAVQTVSRAGAAKAGGRQAGKATPAGRQKAGAAAGQRAAADLKRRKALRAKAKPKVQPPSFVPSFPFLLPASDKPPMVLLTRAPTPMINKDRNLVVLWSPKSACTTTYVWFSQVSGFSEDVRNYSSWPHRHRQEQYQKSILYLESAKSDMSGANTVRVLRDPYSRAVSIYRHALQTRFAEADLHIHSQGKMTAEEGYSFQAFLDFVSALDMNRVDMHFRPQLHPYEQVRKPDRYINITKQDLFTELNKFEKDAGLPETNFEDLNWLHSLESKRKAKQEPMEGDALDTVSFSRHQVARLGQFPSYDQLLTPEAREKIESIYKADFDAYRDYL